MGCFEQEKVRRTCRGILKQVTEFFDFFIAFVTENFFKTVPSLKSKVSRCLGSYTWRLKIGLDVIIRSGLTFGRRNTVTEGNPSMPG